MMNHFVSAEALNCGAWLAARATYVGDRLHFRQETQKLLAFFIFLSSFILKLIYLTAGATGGTHYELNERSSRAVSKKVPRTVE